MGPLDGFRVIELATMVSAPIATMLLADQGAEVIKVEAPPHGDIMRRLGPQRGGGDAGGPAQSLVRAGGSTADLMQAGRWRDPRTATGYTKGS